LGADGTASSLTNPTQLDPEGEGFDAAQAGAVLIAAMPLALDKIARIDGLYTEHFHNETAPFNLDASAIFTEFYFDVADNHKLTLGLRYTEDKKKVRTRATFYDSALVSNWSTAADSVEDAAGNETAVDIMATETADEYWQRSDQFNTSVDIAFTQPALDGLARVIEKWVKHFLSLSVRVTPMLQIEDDKWAWHLGLDAQATSILNDLYHDKNVSESRLKQILCLFKLEADSGFVTEMKGKPVYMGLAMDAAGVVRFKPQNLLMNLPLAPPS